MIQSPVSILLFITCQDIPIGSEVSQDAHSTYTPCLLSVHCSIRRDMFLRTQRHVSVNTLLSSRELSPLFFWALSESTVVDDLNLQLCSIMFPLELNEAWRIQIIPITKGNRREIRIYETSWKYLPLRLQTSYINSLKQNFGTTVSEAVTWAIGMDNTLFRGSFLSS
jgi:hypothetical protein